MTQLLKSGRLLLLCFISFLLMVPGALGQQSDGAQSLRLERLEFEGLKRYGQDQIVEASELKIGQTVNEDLLDQAANRLVQTGFFTNVSYRVRATRGLATITFQLEERVAKGLPVVFDNFVWFTDEDLIIAIRHEIPSFDGTALEVGNMTENIKTVLQRLLEAKTLPGQVEYMPSADSSGAVVAHVFAIKGVKIPICEVAFSGTSAIKDNELREHVNPIFKSDYSRGVVVGFANITLGDLYRERGYLRALFGDASVKTMDNADCKNGVAVTLSVVEGLQYSWDKSEWIDNRALSTQELDSALEMKQGELANITKIEKGMVQVKKAFGKKGYISASLRPMREFDDATRRVTFRIKIIEGAQYKMGMLTIKGLPDEAVAHLKSLWKLAPGVIYDASYLDDFINTVIAKDELLAKARAGTQGEALFSEKPDRQSSTVNVSITFK